MVEKKICKFCKNRRVFSFYTTPRGVDDKAWEERLASPTSTWEFSGKFQKKCCLLIKSISSGVCQLPNLYVFSLFFCNYRTPGWKTLSDSQAFLGGREGL